MFFIVLLYYFLDFAHQMREKHRRDARGELADYHSKSDLGGYRHRPRQVIDKHEGCGDGKGGIEDETAPIHIRRHLKGGEAGAEGHEHTEG